MGFGRTLSIVSAASAFLVLAGGYGMVVEIQPFVQRASSIDRTIDNIIAAPSVSAASSLYALEQLTRDCDAAVSAFSTAGFLAEIRDEGLAACGERMDQVTAVTPGFSYAWLVKAKVAEQIGDQAMLANALKRSQATAPYQRWLAASRYEIMMRQPPAFVDDVTPVLNADLKALAQSFRGVQVLAGRYVADPGFRDKVVSVVETLDVADQRRFLNNVKRATAERENMVN